VSEESMWCLEILCGVWRFAVVSEESVWCLEIQCVTRHNWFSVILTQTRHQEPKVPLSFPRPTPQNASNITAVRNVELSSVLPCSMVRVVECFMDILSTECGNDTFYRTVADELSTYAVQVQEERRPQLRPDGSLDILHKMSTLANGRHMRSRGCQRSG
jgi:hypothetical protein